ncbi:hypothetical protein Hdeb2414_s0044g00742011 [Helianthus debilis subsp. tardiflorus]
MEEQYDLKSIWRFHGGWFGRRRQRRFLAPGLQGKHRSCSSCI